MTALPDWMVGGLTVAEYDALPEEICRQIEVVDGAVIVCASPGRPHQRVARHLANALEVACGPQWSVATVVDLHLRGGDYPVIRRPDIVVYDACLPDEVPLRPEHCLMVVEVMSPGSVTRDQVDKPAEFAVAGIHHFWRAELDERTPTLFRYQLDPTTRTYASAGFTTGKLVVSDPFDVSIDLGELL